MAYEVDILNLLLDRYERSGHCLPGKESNRRIMLNLSKGEIKGYRENDPNATAINHAIEILAAEMLITALWRKGYDGWLYDKVILNLEELEKVYKRAGREPLSKTADAIRRIISNAKPQIKSPWKNKFLEDEDSRLRLNLRTSRLLTMNEKLDEAVLKVLQYTENGPELMRVISVNCFSDSKFLEKNILSQLISIAKAYEPELVAYHSMGDEHLTQSAVMEQIGILTNPEIIEFCGSARLLFTDNEVRADVFQHGFCMQSDNLRLLTEIDISHIATLLFIENRTNYARQIIQGVPSDTLVVCHGGFYSPAKGSLFSLLAGSMTSATRVLFWGDIDLGGFLMFTRLKRELFPSLAAWRMGREDFDEHKTHGLRRSPAYLELLQKKMNDGQFDSVFYPVAQSILESGVTVEQEVML